jgi:peptidoglycan/LPS O-acetylase OafA/YrhL
VSVARSSRANAKNTGIVVFPTLPASADEVGSAAAGTRRIRRLDIQGLRAIAVLMVVAFHSGLPVPGGFVGVDVFFVISGFVITAMLMREWATTGRIRFGRFYIRRFKRLTPALALMVAVTVMISVFVLSPFGAQQNAAKTAFGAIFLVANLVIAETTGGYFDAAAGTNPLLNVWSLSVEEQFYLAFPAILAAGWLLARKARILKHIPFLLVGSVGAVSFGLAVLTSTGWTPPHAASLLGFYSPFTRAWEFAIGGLLSLTLTKFAITSRNLALILGLLGSSMFAASLWLINKATPFPGVWTLLPVIGTLLLILAGTHSSNIVTRVLATGPMVKIGDWSYSIYLWHWPLIVFAALLWPNNPAVVFVAALVSFGPALVSYRWVEAPIRKLNTLSGRRLALIVAATLTPPLVLAGALWFAVQNDFWSPAVSGYETAILPWHTGRMTGCDTAVPSDQRKSGDCTWNASAPGTPIYLVGDSNAYQFSEGIIRAAATLHRPVILSTADGCPYLDVYFRRDSWANSVNDQCRAYLQGTQKYLTSSTPGLVIIAAADEYWNNPDVVMGLTSQRATADPNEKMKVLDAGLTSTVRTLQQAGQTVMLVQTPPHWTGAHAWNPDHCSTLTVLAQQCVQEMSVEQAENSQGAVRKVLSEVSSTTGAAVLDLWASLCPNHICTTQTGRLIRYRDEAHISVSQSEALAPEFWAAIAKTG